MKRCSCEKAIRMNSFVAAVGLAELSKHDRSAVEKILRDVEEKYGGNLKTDELCECGHRRNTHDPCCVSACGCDGFTPMQSDEARFQEYIEGIKENLNRRLKQMEAPS